ncbi:MAG: retroviral-like aspartic protease family protein [Candidatus Aenigmarchaeota archaeon]|nr:retroviral-like aspartic protease family protein [Candidatus Aenigmarchaeota archaeon]
MGYIREDVELVGTLKSKKISALFDSGAYRNYVKRKLADGEDVGDVGFHIFEGIHKAVLATGDTATGERVRFKEVLIRGHVVNEPEFVIMDNFVEDMILGVSLMQTAGVMLDPPNEKIVMTLK